MQRTQNMSGGVQASDAFTGSARLRADWRLLWATVRVHLLRWASTPIMLIRAPLIPLLLMVTFALAYEISGQSTVPAEDVVGFLVIGMVGMLAWNSTIWGSGHALQSEIYSGTIAAVVAAPTRTPPVVLGYGIGAILWDLPGLASCIGAGALLGAGYDISDPVAVLVAVVAVYVSSLCIGVGFGGLFILSRQSNALSNFLQAPVWLLAGFYVPRSVLPDWLQPVGELIPLAHTMDALRAAALDGQSLAGLGGDLLAAGATSALFLAAGWWGLRQVDNVVRRRGTLDLL
jgi:ABC-2 type transport system permease protein